MTTNPNRRDFRYSDALYEFQSYLPEGFESEATTVLEALQQAKAVLEDEARWMQSTWFTNSHPEVDPEDPFCNSWGVCLEGAVGIVTTGACRLKGHYEDDYGRYTDGHGNFIPANDSDWTFRDYLVSTDQYGVPRSDLHRAAVRALAKQLPPIVMTAEEADHGGYLHSTLQDNGDGTFTYQPEQVPTFNDFKGTTRTDVLAVIDKAIEAEKADPTVI